MIVEGSCVQFGWLHSEYFETELFGFSDDSRPIETRLHIHAFVVIHQPAGSIDQLLLAQPQANRSRVVESAADINERFMKVTLVFVDARSWSGVVAHLLRILERSKQSEVGSESHTRLRDDSLKPVTANRLWTRAPVRILEPLIFGALFETQRQVEAP